MIKSILFIYLELFTLRYAKKYSKQDLFNVRRFLMGIISDLEFDCISQYLIEFRSYGVFLKENEYLIIVAFIRYITKLDKIIKM